MWLLSGGGGNGKTTKQNTLIAVLGPFAGEVSADVICTTRPAAAGGPQPHMMPLSNLRQAWIAELGKEAKLNEAAMQKASGGGTLTARDVYKGLVTWRAAAVLLLQANFTPTTDTSLDSQTRRWNIIPYKMSWLPKHKMDAGNPRHRLADPNFPKQLLKELPGILAWSVQAAKDYYQSGGFKEVPVPERVLTATQEFFGENNWKQQFFDACLELVAGAKVTAADVYKAYKEWAEAQGETRVLTNNAFGKEMKTLSALPAPERSRSGMVYHGVRLRGTAAEVAPAVPV